MKTAAELLSLLASQLRQQAVSDDTNVIKICRATAAAVVQCSSYSAQYWLKQLLATGGSLAQPAFADPALLLRCTATLYMLDAICEGERLS